MIPNPSKISNLFYGNYIFLLLVFVLTANTGVWAQSTITGRVINKDDKKPIANVNVFLSNATIGDKTAADGTFTLTGIKPGSYDLVVSIVGFTTYSQPVKLNNDKLTLPDIEIKPKTIALHEVVIKPHDDKNRDAYLEIFTREFLGSSDLAADCTIVNPAVIDFDYDEATGELKASSYDFLVIENKALGYGIKYLLTDFSRDRNGRIVQYHGSVLFENMKGTAQQQRRWLKMRQEVYEGSEMHFLRSLLNDQLDAEGFRILQYANHKNLQRPPDSLIKAKIEFYEKLKTAKEPKEKWRDSLAVWQKRSELPYVLKTLVPFPLEREEILHKTNQEGIYAVGCDFDALYIDYNKNHNYKTPFAVNINDRFNNGTTIMDFASLFTFFDTNGWIINPGSRSFSGAWGRYRVAGMLPSDYEPSTSR